MRAGKNTRAGTTGRGAPGRYPLARRIREAARASHRGEVLLARTRLHRLLRELPAHGKPVERLAAQFARALLARIDGDVSGSGNLYVQGRDPRDMLAAFRVLVEATPLVRFGHAATGTALLEAAAGASHIHVIDIGIGSGIQWVGFLDALAARGDRPRVRLTGIDVPGPGPDPYARLWLTGEDLRKHAARCGIDLRYQAWAGAVEDLDFTQIPHAGDETLLVNAAFALHHVPAGDGVESPAQSRNAVLQRLRRLPVRLLTLVEPDADHNRLPFLLRVAEAFRHYGTVFEVLGALLADHPAERETLEASFFGREILNVVAGEGSRRVERHERHEWWQLRMGEQGFVEVPLPGVTARHLGLHAPFSIDDRGKALRLRWRGRPLVAASAWAPRR